MKEENGLLIENKKFFFIPHSSPFLLQGKGFTLLEVLISLAIVGGLLVTLICTLNYHLSLAERQESITIATLLAKSEMTEMETKPDSKKGAFEAPYNNFTYETFVKESPYISISEIIVVVKAGNEEVKLNEFIFK